MDLTVKVGYLIKCCMKLIAVISHDNYYSQLGLKLKSVIYENYFETEQYSHSIKYSIKYSARLLPHIASPAAKPP
jgi:hypothetical protein